VSDIAPGWYKDPAEPTTQRYWDGEGWLGDPLPVDATPPSGPPGPAAATATAPPAGRPTAAPPAGAHPVPPPRGAHPVPPPGTVPPGTVPPGTVPPGTVPPGTVPPGTVPAGAAGPGLLPPGAIPWRPGMPVPPGYRLAYPVAPAPLPHGLPVAPLGRRLLARLIDIAIVLGLSAVATSWLAYQWFRDVRPLIQAIANQASYDNLPVPPFRATVLLWVIPIVAMLVWLAYEVPALAGRGQTVGKRAVGIKVMAAESTSPLGFGRALARWSLLGAPTALWTCCYGLTVIPQLIDSLSPTWGGPLHLALHDRSARTVVVHCGRRGHEITPVPAPGRPGESS
jgi:uncharacterized RDD family membrane protein YckC